MQPGEWERPADWKIPVTLGEEVDQALAEWYGRLGQPIPPDEVGLGARWDAERAAAFQEEARMARVMSGEEAPQPGAEETLEAKAVRLRALVGPKPDFGTDAFWSWAKRKKIADNAEREAKGLPPLPTAKEKAAAAAAKAAEKAAGGTASKK